MKQTWDDYESAAKRGPMPIFWKALVALLVIFGTLWLIAYALGWFGQAANVAQEEFGARAALEKYSWFKEASAQLEKKRADISVYRSRITALEKTYEGKSRSEWPREDREQWSTWQSEVAGATASYNQLAAEYNAKMAEIHWRFANAGDLPRGASEPLPREFKPYEEK